MKKFSRKICFENFGKFWKFFEKSQNSIGISMIPFITCYKGNHRNPYRILGFFKNFQKKRSKIFKNIFFEKHFSSRKKISKFFWTPMSIRNFPKLPKIILRKSADQAKGEKNPLCKLAILICGGYDVLLRGVIFAKMRSSSIEDEVIFAKMRSSSIEDEVIFAKMKSSSRR